MSARMTSWLGSGRVWQVATALAPVFLSGFPAAELENLGLTALLQLAEGQPVTLGRLARAAAGSPTTQMAAAVWVIGQLEKTGYIHRQSQAISLTAGGREWAIWFRIKGARAPLYVPSIYMPTSAGRWSGGVCS